MQHNLVPTSTLDFTVKTATKRWQSKNKPDTFRTRVTVKDTANTDQLSVRIDHRETFPSGGRTFNVDIRSVPDNKKSPGNLIHRQKIHLAAGA